jgi:hypothetical protein
MLLLLSYCNFCDQSLFSVQTFSFSFLTQKISKIKPRFNFNKEQVDHNRNKNYVKEKIAKKPQVPLYKMLHSTFRLSIATWR